MIKNFVFIGPPGCGKGTQSMLLSTSLGYTRLSTGDLFREIAKKDSDLGKKVKDILAVGDLISDELVNDVIDKFYSEINGSKKIILDGYPRNITQAIELNKILAKHKSEVTEVFYFDISDQVLLKRILGRYTCNNCGKIYNKFFYDTKVNGHCDECNGTDFSKRDDDSKEVLLNRLEVFRKTTKPLLEFYDKKLIKINAEQSAAEVSKQMLKFFV
jgi:adenylate kinase